ncbi:MAG: hypothetical protein ACRED9_12965 [Caulobacteraceae bacterium]
MSAAEVEVLLIGGRAGVGKSTAGWEVSRQLQELDVAHCLIEGDNLDQIHPAPPDDPVREKISEANLRAVWANYFALGQRRLVYTNTVAVTSADWMTRAMGSNVRFIGALLTAGDETIVQRLGAREVGGGLDWHLERSRKAAKWLEKNSPGWVHRVASDGLAAAEVARKLIGLTDWSKGDRLGLPSAPPSG